jgi:microcystin-dependent protein
MKARIIILIVALASVLVLLGQRAGTGASVEAPFLADMPVGSIVVYAGDTAPEGWLMCDGELYDIADCPDLFEVIKFAYGSNTAKTAFRVPDLAGRVPVGPVSWSWEFKELGKTGGETEVSLTESQMPAHTHNVSASSHTHSVHTSAHSHSVSVSPHSHGINDPKHDHTVNDQGHEHNINDPGHRHTIELHDDLGKYYVDDSGRDKRGEEPTSVAYTGITIRKAWTGVKINPHTTGISVQPTAVSASIGSASVSGSTSSANINISEDSAGSGSPHTNLQPYIVLNYIIKY